MSEELCKHCGMKPLKECSGSHIPIDGNSCKECPNMRLARMAETIRGRMTPEMLRIPHVANSPLYTPRKKTETAPSVDRTKDNLYIRGLTRRGLLAHLKLVLLCQPLRYHMIDDAFILEVFLGKQQYSNKPKDVRDAIRTFNSITDLVGSDFDLVIITLGIQSYKNISSPSQLLETLKRRRDIYDRATWVLEPPGSNWSYSRDDNVEEYLAKHFEVVELESDLEDPVEEILISDDSEGIATLDTYDPTPPVPTPKKRRIQIEATPNLSDFEDLVTGNMSQTKKFKGRRY